MSNWPWSDSRKKHGVLIGQAEKGPFMTVNGPELFEKRQKTKS